MLGTWLSGYFILVANSWMQHPVGYKIVNGEAQLTSVWALLSNGFALRAYLHTMLAGLIFGSIVMLGVCCWHFLRGRDVELFRKAAKLALIVAVPVTLLQLVVGNRFGEAVTSAQSMKIAASEAQWNTCQPCGFSLFQIGGFTESDETPSFSITIPRLLSLHGRPARSTARFRVSISSRPRSSKVRPAATTCRMCEVIYWSMRVMAYMGVLMLLVAVVGAWLYWKQRLERARWFLWTAIVAIAFPYIAATAGWLLTEMGRQPWIVQGLLLTSKANSPSVSSVWLGVSLAVFITLYVVLGVVDFVLMRRYARRELDGRRGSRRRRRRRTDMDLQTLWFVLIAVLWAAYFLLEGFDFGVGMLLPFLPRDEKQRATMFESIGPVWDGNEVWLVIAGGATFAAFPDWYATMFSGFYIALLLVLVCLIVRVVSFEWRGKGEGPRWRAVWTWANCLGSFGASFIWGVALANLVHGVPLDSNGDFAGDFGDLFSGYTVVAGLAVVLLFAFHGATYLTIRTTGDLCERASRAARRLSLAAALAGAAFLAWTVAVAVDRNDKSVFPPILPAVLGDRRPRARGRASSAAGEAASRSPRRPSGSWPPWRHCSRASTRG